MASLEENQQSLQDNLYQLENQIQIISQRITATHYSLRLHQLHSFTIDLLRVTQQYLHQWQEISQAVLQNRHSQHTIPLHLLDQARQTFRAFYGSEEQHKTLGIVDLRDEPLPIPTIKQSEIAYLAHHNGTKAQLITQLHIPIYQHNQHFINIPHPNGPSQWLITDNQTSTGALISHAQRLLMTTYYQTTYCNDRLINLNAPTVACLINAHNAPHQCRVNLHRLDDNHFLYMGTRHTVNIDCHGGTYEQLHLVALQIVYLPYKCGLSSTIYTIPKFSNEKHQSHLKTIISTHSLDNSLFNIEIVNLTSTLTEQQILSVKLAPKHNNFLKADFEGSTSLLYNRLHRRLQQRKSRDDLIDRATRHNLWPLYLLAAIALTGIGVGLAILIYILRFA